MNEATIITFANQKGGVGKTTLCTLFANYLVARGKRTIVIDCDGQQTIFEKRKADHKKYSDLKEPYKVQAFNIADPENVKNLMLNLRQLNGTVLIDAPGNLAQQGLIPLFVHSDYIVCPYQYETTSINSTVTFLGFILQLKKRVQSMATKIFFVVNRHDKRYGTEREKQLWAETDEGWSKFGIVTPKIEQRVEMQRYNTVSLMNTQETIVKPAFDCIYNEIYPWWARRSHRNKPWRRAARAAALPRGRFRWPTPPPASCTRAGFSSNPWYHSLCLKPPEGSPAASFPFIQTNEKDYFILPIVKKSEKL